MYLIKLLWSALGGAFRNAFAAVWIFNPERVLPSDKALPYGSNPQLILKYPIFVFTAVWGLGRTDISFAGLNRESVLKQADSPQFPRELRT